MCVAYIKCHPACLSPHADQKTQVTEVELTSGKCVTKYHKNIWIILSCSVMLIQTKTVIQDCGWDVMIAVQVNNMCPIISNQVTLCNATYDRYLSVLAISKLIDLWTLLDKRKMAKLLIRFNFVF